jgi:hypothetical protein
VEPNLHYRCGHKRFANLAKSGQLGRIEFGQQHKELPLYLMKIIHQMEIKLPTRGLSWAEV